MLTEAELDLIPSSAKSAVHLLFLRDGARCLGDFRR